MIIRKVNRGDVAGLKAVDVFGKQLNEYGGVDALDAGHEDEEDVSYYLDFIEGDQKWCYIAEDGGKIVGFVLFNVKNRESYYKIKEIGYIDLLFVKSSARGKGAGNKLLSKAVDVLKEVGMSYIDISVHSDNPAVSFWEKTGFKEYRKSMFKKL